MDSIKKKARNAGLLYLVSGITAPLSLIYIPSTLIVPGNATATAQHVRNSETLLRAGIGTELFSAVMFIFVVLALYRLFKEVSEKHAVAMAILLLISIPISLFNVLNELAAMFLVSGAAFLSPFDPRQLDAMAYLFIRLYRHGHILAGIFWGLWLFPFGILVIRSGFIPRFIGYSLFAAGSGYLISSLSTLIVPRYAPLLSPFAMVLMIGELPIILWLLIWGAKSQPTTAPAFSTKGQARAAG